MLVAGMASLLDSAAIVSVGAALPLWRTALGLDAWTVGFVSSSLTLAIALGALVGGRLADRWGRHRVFLVTVVGYVAGAGLTATANQGWHLCLGVVVLGLSSGADLPASIALVAERTPEAVRARMVASTQVLWTVGILVATGLAFAASPAGLTGMRTVLWTLAGAAALTVLVGRSLPPPDIGDPLGESPPAEGGARTGGGRSAVRGRTSALVAVALFYVAYTLVANTFGSFRTYFLVVVAGASQTTATAVAFAMTVIGLGGTLLFSVIAGSSWRRRLYPPAAVLLICSQVLLALTGGQSLGWFVAALTLYSLAYPYVGEGLYKVWAQTVAPAELRATYQGLTIAAARAGAALFALVTPVLMTRHVDLFFGLLAGSAVVAMALGAVVDRLISRADPGGAGRWSSRSSG